MTITELILKAETEVKKQAEGDLLFSGCRPLAKLSDEDKRVICNALKQYAVNGATRAIRFADKHGFIKL